MALMNSSFARINKKPCNDDSKASVGFELPDPREFDIFIVKDVATNYVLNQDDSNKYLVFNDATTAILRVPDNMYRGTALLATNVGLGSVQVVFDGLETVRGDLLIRDENSFISLIKITDSMWQSSER
jgi:hypothetical protein